MNTTNKSTKQLTMVKQQDRWYPVNGNVIDMRSTGWGSKREIAAWRREYEQATGTKVSIQYR